MPDNDNAIDPNSLDMLTRTIIGEAGNQPPIGQAAVAHVVLNRLNSGKWGNDVTSVVTAPSQFEPWSTRSAELAAIPRDSPQYQSALGIAQNVVNGSIPDPTHGAMNFANVATVQSRGNQSAMNWINKMTNVTRIGDHTFGNADGPAPQQAQAAPLSDIDLINQYLKSDASGAPQTAPAAYAVPAAPLSDSDLINSYLKPADTSTATQKKKFGWADTWPVQIAKTIASGLTLPGDVYQGNATVPQSANLSLTGQEDTSNIGRLTNLAGVVGTGAIPNIAGKAAPLIDGNTATLADLARNTYDIPLRGGQISPNRSINYLDSVLQDKPFSGMAQSSADQSAAFNRAVSNTIGENTDKITPDVMDAAKKRLGASYEDIASQSTIQADDKLGTDLNQIASDANTVLSPSERTIVHGQISNILDKVQGTGEIDGKTYQALIKTGSPLDRATKSNDSNVKYYAGQVKQSLLDALSRSVSPELQDQLAATNSQYKAMKTIEPLVEKSTTGDISPALLMGATRQSYSNMAYGGGGDLANLSRIGQRFLKEPPNSGTANRLSAMKILGIGGASGIEAGLAFHDPMMAAKIGGLAALAGMGKGIVNAGVGSALRSNWYANKLINSALPGRTPNMLDKLTNSAIPYYPPLPIMSVAPQNAYQPQ